MDENKKNLNIPTIVLAVLVLAFVVCQYILKINIVSYVVAFLAKLGVVRPEITEGVGYGTIFIFGLITSLHCVGMCGGITLAVGKGQPLFQLGRVISYTLMGLLLGGLGSIINIDVGTRKIIPIICGICIIAISCFWFLNGVGIKLPKKYLKIIQFIKKQGPLGMGLLMALMPCMSLQMVELYSLGTGNAVKGAFSMFLFAVGTLPMLILLGIAGNKAMQIDQKKVQIISALIMLVMGIMMVLK
ncbi:MAG: sulfite exporter TauE/SafE family protein [Clostridia bacterium]|nr:sulfite exporter TauE/SafE family protein [Clostridia bacterium]